ncbi:MAG: RagB/SusD family nutrient uptake outer membrane protein [Duncaniella sp.]|nr:RagB/SusD family nutrient uptake outer membrane protein [Duncaniella sp.]
MKLRNIFIAGMSVLALSGCSDYLEVDAPSKNTLDYVFSRKVEMERALNGVYSGLLSNNTFGNNIFTSFQLNSDVDFATNSSASDGENNYKRFDCKPTGSQINNTWSTIYDGIELANLFIEGVESSPLYDAEDPDADIVQMLGEAKVIRAIYYHELIWMFGDVPFSFNSTKTAESTVYPITDRVKIIDELIADIESVADKMKTTAEATVERPNKEMAWGMIARLALTAGGYTLRPEGDTYGKMERPNNYKDYYQIARDYAWKVIEENTHKLDKPYYKVFYDECNFNIANAGDDPMFEIPFGKESTGNIGYIQGVSLKSYDGATLHSYGEASSSAGLNAFYRYMFDKDDVRRDYVNQLFYYDANATANPTLPSTGYTVNNGKWSKLWVNGGLGATTKGSTGINYPYMRYTDVLLMFAEADNEVNDGPTAEAKAALEQVRTRAFPTAPEKVTDYPQAGKDEFLKSVLDERKFEFAGENMRWRDLVRNNLYNEVVYWTFFRYYSIAYEQIQTYDNLNYVSEYDFGPGVDDGYSNLPIEYFYIADVDNIDENNEKILPESAFPNQDVKICRILNPYSMMNQTQANAVAKGAVSRNYINAWVNDETPKNEIHFSLLGYIYADENDWLKIVDNGNKISCPEPSTNPTYATLPVLRYILPIPNDAIRRSGGKYVNQYGYK